MEYAQSHEAWARETFSNIVLGDRRLTERLVQIGAAVAARPAGTVTAAMGTSAEKEATFRFVENERVSPLALLDGICKATAVACSGHHRVYIPIDQTDLTFTDTKGIRGLGENNRKVKSTRRSAQIMNSLALDEEGVPLGLLDQQWWLWDEEKAPDWKHDKRPPEERDSWYWLRAFSEATERLKRAAPDCSPWLIGDRGADYRLALKWARDNEVLVTIRAAYNRAIEHKGRGRKLDSTLCKQPIAGMIDVHVSRTSKRIGRIATCEVRFVKAIRIKVDNNQWRTFSAVRIRERGHVPSGQTRIDWTLLTTYDVTSFDEAKEVIHSYTLRWRVEEFHRTWKTGACDVESSQLRSYPAIQRWSMILAAVATRVERLKLLSRQQPNLDARTEFSQEELDAAIYMTKTKKWVPGDTMTLEDAVRLVAMAGGYMGRKGDGPPGSITIRRGLERVIPAAEVLRAERSG